MGRNILVVTTTPAEESSLADALQEHIGADATIRIVAPAARISKLDWLTNAEDDARAEAAEAAESAAAALGDQGSVQIDRASQDTEAAQSIDDALRAFPADEIVVVTSPGDEATWLEDETVSAAFERSGVPVRRVELPAQA